MRKLFISIFLLVAALPVFAGIVSQEEAQRKAEDFWQSTVGMSLTRSAASIEMVMAEPKKSMTRSAEAAFYIFTTGEKGFVIVSGDDRTPAIIGYSLESTFDINNIPANMRAWLDGYVNQISDATATSLAASNASQKEPIEPLVEAKWYQDAPYNGQCPTIDGQPTYTGCVATALAQVMNKWKQPSLLPACDAYQYDDDKGIISVPAISEHIIEWSQIRNEYGSGETDDNIAWLMRHCGQELLMNYGVDISVATGECVEKALDNFGYDRTVHVEPRVLYTSGDWEDLIYNELANGRPMVYGGQNTDGGHAFVCDGYDGSGGFHINWGWGGISDGYYRLSLLEPGEQGIGGSSAGYTNGHLAIVGISYGQSAAEKPAHFLYTTDEYLSDNKLYFILNSNSGYTSNMNLYWGILNDDNTITKKVDLGPFELDPDKFLKEVFPLNFIDTDGTYRVVLCSQEGTSPLKSAFREGKYIIYTKAGETVTTSFNQEAAFSAVINSITGNTTIGFSLTVDYTLTNNGTADLGKVEYYVSEGDEPRFIGEVEVSLEPGQSRDYSFTLNTDSLSAGSHKIYIVQNDRDIASDDVELTAASPTTFDNLSINSVKFAFGTPLKAIVNITNGNDADYSYPVVVSVLKGVLGNNYIKGWSTFEATQTIPAGETLDVEIPIDKFNADGEYAIYYAGVYQTPGAFIGSEINYLNNWSHICAANINEEGIITYARQYALDFSADLDDLSAYSGKMSTDGTKVELTKQSGLIAAGTGLVLKGTPNANYAIPCTQKAGTTISYNDLVGVTTDTAVSANSTYVLDTQDDIVGFYTYDGTTITAGRAYIEKPVDSPAPYLELTFSCATNIKPTFEETSTDDAIYNIHGQKVGKHYKGIIIKNGKKLLMK